MMRDIIYAPNAVPIVPGQVVLNGVFLAGITDIGSAVSGQLKYDFARLDPNMYVRGEHSFEV